MLTLIIYRCEGNSVHCRGKRVPTIDFIVPHVVIEHDELARRLVQAQTAAIYKHKIRVPSEYVMFAVR